MNNLFDTKIQQYTKLSDIYYLSCTAASTRKDANITLVQNKKLIFALLFATSLIPYEVEATNLITNNQNVIEYTVTNSPKRNLVESENISVNITPSPIFTIGKDISKRYDKI